MEKKLRILVSENDKLNLLLTEKLNENGTL